LSADDIVGNLPTCERARTSILFRCNDILVSGSVLVHGALSSGATYSLNFTDIDGKKLSTADGHVTLLVLAGTADGEKARAVGDQCPIIA
jgi:hypothetical protein